ncbi:ADAM family mig-17 [Biomphalaria glabrata]|nr:ADAM family mig-17 [Biomphalaria glabrata]
MHFIILIISVAINQISSTEVIFQYEASDVTGDLMPDEVNVTFSTETKSLTKLNLRRSRHFDLDIPLYTLDTDQEGFFQKQKVTTKARKDLGFYQDIDNKAVFRIEKSPEKTANKKAKYHLKGEFHVANSKYFFNSEKKTPKKSWKNKSLKRFLNSTTTAPTTSDATSIFQEFVYTLESQNITTFDMFDARIPPPEVKESVQRNDIERQNQQPDDTGHNSNRSTSWSAPQSRRRRSLLRDYYVDVVAVIDHQVYSKFLTLANDHNPTALRNIQEHYAFLFSGMDMLYQGIKSSDFTIHIRLCKIYVLQTFTASSFIDSYASYGDLNGETALRILKTFSTGAGRGIVGIYDHVMLFTGYDLYTLNSYYQRNMDVIGIANIGTMCRTDGTSCSVIEDRNGYSTIDTATHELGHSLSAQHDGVTNLCSFSQRYIMAASNSIETHGTEYNPWQFSPCSISYFTSFLTRMLDTSRGHTCLAYAIEATSDIPDVSDKLLGQLVKPDQQCQQLYGKTSHYCRSVSGYTSLDICHAMFCLDPLNPKICYHEAALTGTSCGDGKICINGHCVVDPFAPQADEKCLFGDTPDNTCPSLVQDFKGNCYRSVNYELCCDSCNNVSRPIRGCEYGDKNPACKPYYCTSHGQECCGTCNYGIPFTRTTSTTRTTPKRLATPAIPLLMMTSVKECVLGDPDLRPELCTSPTICQTQPLQCCNYCSLHYSSATILSFYDIWIYISYSVIVLFSL